MKANTWIACGALLGGLAVVLGAFGAHGLTDYLAAHPADRQLRNRSAVSNVSCLGTGSGWHDRRSTPNEEP